MITDERPPSRDGIMLGVAAPESLGATLWALGTVKEELTPDKCTNG